MIKWTRNNEITSSRRGVVNGGGVLGSGKLGSTFYTKPPLVSHLIGVRLVSVGNGAP